MKFSIITINYNNVEGLRKTIDSVVSQTFTDYEWIVIDGGSTDGSKELIEEYQHFFSYWCSESDNGVYNAMNKGIVYTNGNYINFMNSGDVYASERTLQEVAKHHHDGDILFGDWICVYETKEVQMTFPIDMLQTEFTRRNICHQAIFYKSYLLKLKGFDESIAIWADYARNVELSLSGASFEYLPFVICRYDMNGISSSKDSLLIRKKNRESINLLYPKGLLPLLLELDMYRNRRIVRYTLGIVDGKSKFLSIITKVYIKTTYMICSFFNILKNEEKNG